MRNVMRRAKDVASVSTAALVFCGDHGVKKADAALSPYPASATKAARRRCDAGPLRHVALCATRSKPADVRDHASWYTTSPPRVPAGDDRRGVPSRRHLLD